MVKICQRLKWMVPKFVKKGIRSVPPYIQSCKKKYIVSFVLFLGYNWRATTGKTGAQWTVLCVEAEGPNAKAGANWEPTKGFAGAFADAALGRAELHILGVVVSIEPNLNTGIGLRDRQLEVKVLGFGFSLGSNGVGLHTPLGTFAFENLKKR